MLFSDQPGGAVIITVRISAEIQHPAGVRSDLKNRFINYRRIIRLRHIQWLPDDPPACSQRFCIDLGDVRPVF